ncbi:MAG: LysR family transcriptional regulator [Magnetospirillum sp.]|nr:LysR family transcriptional regulator [Magnetospirillum sp.]
MSKFRLHDWNDVRLLIAIAENGSFAAAATALGIDQTTVSRRIAHMEAAIGRPLFTRRRSGAAPTQLGLVLLERARVIEAATQEFERAMNGLETVPPPAVTIASSDGLLTYTIIPTLLGNSESIVPLDRSLIREPLPALAFTTSLAEGDIAIFATNPGELPQVRGAMRVRRIGTMNFVPVASRAYLDAHPAITHFDDLRHRVLLDVSIYRAIRALDDWNGLVAEKPEDEVIVSPTTPAMYRPLLDENRGVGVLPPYSVLYEPRLVALDIPTPILAVSLWIVAHEDKLREPAIRTMYDLLASMFLQSTWFRQRR